MVFSKTLLDMYVKKLRRQNWNNESIVDVDEIKSRL